MILINYLSSFLVSNFTINNNPYTLLVLVLLFGLSQHAAQGTTLALMVPPIGLLAAWTYYKEGFVDLKIAAFICLGFFIGGLIGAEFAAKIPNDILRRIFGMVLLLMSLKMIFFK